MKTIVPALFLFFLPVLLTAQNAKIVGGEDADEGQFPWIACMYVLDQPGCAGALVAPEWVLTAAHCLFDEDLSIFKIRLNSANAYGPLNPDGGEERTIVEAHVHPEYNYDDAIGQYVDLALLRLSEPVTSIAPVMLPTSGNLGDLYDSWTPVHTAGWGMVVENGNTSYPEMLQWVTSSVYDFDMCEESVGYSITDDFFCVGFSEGQAPSGAAVGDSGGPAWIDGKNGVPLLTGIIHGATWDYTDTDLPGVYVAVAKQMEWINSIINLPTGITDPHPLNAMVDLMIQGNQIILQSNDFQGNLDVSILNIQGARLFNTQVEISTGGAFKMDASSLAAGLYIVHVNDLKGSRLSEKVVISN
jgi:secreted trypsin-like serine protease